VRGVLAPISRRTDAARAEIPGADGVASTGDPFLPTQPSAHLMESMFALTEELYRVNGSNLEPVRCTPHAGPIPKPSACTHVCRILRAGHCARPHAGCCGDAVGAAAAAECAMIALAAHAMRAGNPRGRAAGAERGERRSPSLGGVAVRFQRRSRAEPGAESGTCTPRRSLSERAVILLHFDLSVLFKLLRTSAAAEDFEQRLVRRPARRQTRPPSHRR
jgi:hypothetical protein